MGAYIRIVIAKSSSKMTGKTLKIVPGILLLHLILFSVPFNVSAAETASPVAGSASTFLGIPYPIALIICAAILFLLIGRVVSLRSAVKATENPEAVEEKKKLTGLALKWHYIKTTINPIFVVLAILTILTGFTLVDWYNRAQDLGAQVGYSPEQPIKFNHKIHAGQYGIQCQYCHTGVEKTKQANIPSANICMNCHKAITTGPQYGSTELAKLFAAYKSNTPIRWVRIHNLPDHVYFNHSQHVVAGKVKCEQCHGKVQEMERVVQVSTLEMGWCINCHREAHIDSENPYYTSTYDFVKKHKTYTVAQMGGLECSKCHY